MEETTEAQRLLPDNEKVIPPLLISAGKALPYEPTNLIILNSVTFIKPESMFRGPILQERMIYDPDKQRILLTGDTHGMIFPMLLRAAEEGYIKFPLKGQILNVDYHADIQPPTNQTTVHTATWQRYGVDSGFWSRDKSYNWRPDESNAVPLEGFEPGRSINSVNTEAVQKLSPEVLSIDLDFFNGIPRTSNKFNEYLSIIKNLAKKSKVICIFSSSGWTQGKLGIEEIETVVNEITMDL